MAKNDKMIMYGIIGATAIIIVYLLVRNTKTGVNLFRGISSTGCYPLEEVHPADVDLDTMWMSIIKYANDGSYVRPPAGTFNIDLLMFVIASVISRSARFFLVASLINIFGETIRNFIENYFNYLAILFTVLLLGGFILIKYIIT